jgi:hypothetical protein
MLGVMGAAKRDLLIEQGVTWSTAWSVTLDGVALDPADGWQARSQVRAKITDTAVLHQFTTNLTGSVVQLSVQPDESSAWTWRRGVFDVEIFDGEDPSRVIRIVQGTVNVSPEVTR